ncbi:transcriptional Coactivator p15-domain-containing protein [Delphinella strobiligena]|nr:transcriptional Coactivator p15-domain-containing protein [Delphinella strobiligena]
MPPKSGYKSRKRVSEDDYDSDGGFVDDAPKLKKVKTTKAGPPKELQKDDENNEFWELSAKRRVTLSNFKNMQFVNIREYYDKDGKTLPGKKGISLSIEQFNALVELLPQIEDSLKSKGEPVSRPSYGGTTTTTTEPPSDSNDKSAEDNNEVDQAGENGPVEPQQNSNKLEKFKYTRKNHEATSDEEE